MGLFASVFLQGIPLFFAVAQACSKVTYHANVDNRITVGRSMDFVTSTNASIYIFPAGLERNGSVEVNPLRWTSKYGSMVVSMYDKVSIDGINSAGLTGSVLYLGPADYGERNNSRPGLAIGFWLQYYLDTYSSVAEAAADLNTINLQVVTKSLVPGVSSVGHVSLTDSTGDNLILEYLNGTLVSHHGEQYSTFTNDPTYDEQIAIWEYWKPMSNYSLPGTQTPAGKSFPQVLTHSY
jgi:penicillin V acylase-like amidase (Ntn superfamily)